MDIEEMTRRFLLRRRRDEDEVEDQKIEDERRKRAHLEILRAVRERGWWWPDGS